jgi:hypothetical protein
MTASVSRRINVQDYYTKTCVSIYLISLWNSEWHILSYIFPKKNNAKFRFKQWNEKQNTIGAVVVVIVR